MSWARFDDQTTFHPKIIVAGNSAVGAWMRMTTYCCAHGTDGFVAESVAKMIGSMADIEAAKAAGIIEPTEGGYLVHDFLDFNPSADEARQRKEVRSKAGRKGGRRSGASRKRTEANAQANASTVSEANAKQAVEHVLQPKTNPVPSRPEGTETRARAASDAWNASGLTLCANAEALGELQGEIEVLRETAAIAGREMPSDLELCKAFKLVCTAWSRKGIVCPQSPKQMIAQMPTVMQLALGEVTADQLAGEAQTPPPRTPGRLSATERAAIATAAESEGVK